MRRFHSYGPVDSDRHFCVDRKELVRQCTDYLIGDPDKGGSYFTIWGPQQTGKTWIMRQAAKNIMSLHKEKFISASLSMQGVAMRDNDPEEIFLDCIPRLFLDSFDMEIAAPKTWGDLTNLFHRKKSPFDKPVVLLIDEFDSLPKHVIKHLASLFWYMILRPENYLIHSLAIIGATGTDNGKISPFILQPFIQIPNLTKDEVKEMFEQYQNDSGQQIETAVVSKLFEVTRGHPGLVSWFGELLTEKFNPGKDQTILPDTWNEIYARACSTEWNNTVFSLVKKATDEYCSGMLEIFTRSDITFTLRADWCNYMYLHGIIDHEYDESKRLEFCRFSSPYIQLAICDTLTRNLLEQGIPLLDPLDDLSDVFNASVLNLSALICRYKEYIRQLKYNSLNLFKYQDETRHAEAVWYFHLYSWLQSVVGKYCAIIPEFPSGKGKMDLHIRCDERDGVIEVINITDFKQVSQAVKDASDYAADLGMGIITLVIFVPLEDEGDVLQELSGEEAVEGVSVTVCLIGNR
ncbi:MAG: ATP-binding protein [Desulfobacterales bacterium]|nr:ATP-binding protein [Desulfobacterales bacterium]